MHTKKSQYSFTQNLKVHRNEIYRFFYTYLNNIKSLKRKLQGRAADHSPLTSAEVKKTPTAPYVLMA
jgi:hypothetical protein